MKKLIQLIINSGYTIIYPQVDEFLGIDFPQLNCFHSLKNESKTVKNTGQFLKSNLKFISQEFKPPIAIMPFKPSAKTEKICQKQNWLVLSNPAKLNRLLEDKIKFSQLCHQHKLPTIPHLVAPLDQENFLLAQKKFGPKLVLQTHFGWAGNSTFYFESYQEIANKISPNTLCKFSPYLEGYTLINNCCQTKFGLIQSPVGRQLTGLKEYTQNPFATVGRQWPSLAPQSVINQVVEVTKLLSDKLLKKYDYRGFFGIDFFVHQNRVMILEINPRLTASFGFYTKLETDNNITPLFLFHLAEFLNLDYQVDFDREQSRTDSSLIVGTEITPKDKFGKTIAQYHQTSPIIKD
ncbi:MAG: ATP-grasp domain-containing protein [Candidatus Shapirobacteria bacterium]|jgi:predicted ATP-grasp superfamily ATP-dependent carboligase